MEKKSKIFITGHSGMVSLALLNRLRQERFANLLVRTPLQLDLTNQRMVRSFFKREKPDYCFLIPLKEGGIGVNIAYPAELIYENLVIQTNIIHAAYETKVKKLLFFASSCVYPKNCPQPMKEEYLLKGALEPTNEPYALAKIVGIKMCQAYNKQYDTHFISVIPATVFGPNDNFDLKTSHVVSALIRKFHEAKIKKKSKVTVWGSGRPCREFIYVEDLVDACIFLMQRYNSSKIINIGTGIDTSIRDLIEVIKEIVGFEGKIQFDVTKPDGVFKKLLDVHRLNSLGWKSKIELQLGLKNTYQWYLKKLTNKHSH